MIKRLTAAFVLGAFAVSTCPAAVQWTFHPSVRSIDGKTTPYVTALLGANEIRYVPPMGWTLSGSRFIPAGKVEADAYFDAASIQAPAPWTPDRARALHDTVLSRMAPSGATNVAIASEGILPQAIAGQSAYEICFSYSLYAQQYAESVVFFENGKTQFQIHFGSLKPDFPDLHAAFLHSLHRFSGF